VPLLSHLGIGLAAKRILPQIPVWILDFIGWPLSVWVPDPTGIPFFFSDTPNYGLGVYRTWTGALIMDLGILLFGILIFNSWKNKALIKDS